MTMSYGTGFIPSKPDIRDKNLLSLGLGLQQDDEIPEWVETEVKDQGNVSSCLAHAGTSEREIVEKKQTGTFTRLSPGYFFGIRQYSTDWGMYGREGCTIMLKNGVCTQDKFPYNKEWKDLQPLLTPIREQLDQDAYPRRLTAYYALYSDEEIKRALQFSPVMIGMEIFDSFYYLNSSNYRASQTGKSVGGHGMLILNDRPEQGGYEVLNSWGRNWGKSGKFILPYEYAVAEAWGFIDTIQMNKYIIPVDFRTISDQILYFSNPRETRWNPLQGIMIESYQHYYGVAQDEYVWLNTDERTTSPHYLIDNQQIIQTLPENFICIHDCGTIAEKFITIKVGEKASFCGKESNLQFTETWKRLIWLTANICVRHNLTIADVISSTLANQRYGNCIPNNPETFFTKFNKTWKDFQNDLYLEIIRQKGDMKMADMLLVHKMEDLGTAQVIQYNKKCPTMEFNNFKSVATQIEDQYAEIVILGTSERVVEKAKLLYGKDRNDTMFRVLPAYLNGDKSVLR